MIGIVIVSHSYHLGVEVMKIASDMYSSSGIKFPMINASGLEDSALGTDPEKIFKCIKKVHNGRGVILLCDLGSSVQNALKAIAMLEEGEQNSTFIADAPIVEGAIVAASANCKQTDLKCLLGEIEEVKTFPKIRRA